MTTTVAGQPQQRVDISKALCCVLAAHWHLTYLLPYKVYPTMGNILELRTFRGVE